MKCETCEKEISSERVVEYSTQNYGKPLCYDCQQVTKKEPESKEKLIGQVVGQCMNLTDNFLNKYAKTEEEHKKRYDEVMAWYVQKRLAFKTKYE